jgi:2,3-dihydroxybenzoate-AMP ligase
MRADAQAPERRIEWTAWPEEFQARYRAEGYWRGETLPGLLDEAVERAPDDLAVIDGERRLTYAQLTERVSRMTGALRALGIRRYDRVVVQLPNAVEFLDLTFALLRIGAVPVMALPAHRDHEISYLVEHSEAVALAGPVAQGGWDHLEMGQRLRESSPTLRHLFYVGEGGGGDGCHDLSELALCGPPDVSAADGPEPADVALFLLSGGTTGLPKLIPRTHDDYVYNVRGSSEMLHLGNETVYLVSLPVSHNFPLGCPGVFGTIAAGGRIVMSSDPRAESAFALIERERVTITALVPALVTRWLDSPAREAADLSSLAYVQVGGARLAPEIARRIRPLLGATLQQAFGMAEGLLNLTRPDDPEDVIVETQGRPMAAADEIRIVDANDVPVPEGEPGELQTRGPYTLRGYYRADEHNARSFTPDGFYRTGDIVRLTPDGNLLVEGRAKDLINRGGEKISAEEIENLVLSHPRVLLCAAVGMPDPVMGERTCVYVVPRDGEPPTLEELVAMLNERRVARYKLPERLEVVAELPLTKVGKVDKKALREDIRARLEAEPC